MFSSATAAALEGCHNSR